MKDTKTINLNGSVFNIDYDAYQSLKNYMQDIELRLPAEEKKDVMQDIEARIAELVSRMLFAQNVQSVTLDMIMAVKNQIGSPSEFGENKRPAPRKDKSQNSGCGRALGIAIKVIMVVIGLQILLPVLCVAVSVLIVIFCVSTGMVVAAPVMGATIFENSQLMAVLGVIAGLTVIILPIVMIVQAIVSHMRTHHGPKPRFWLITVGIWLAAILTLVIPCYKVCSYASDDMPGLVHLLRSIVHDDDDDAPQENQTYDFTGFNTIEVDGAIEASVIRGNTYAINVESSALDIFKASLENDSVLRLSVARGGYGTHNVEITVPDLDHLNVRGASEVELVGFFDNLDLGVYGASKVDTDDDSSIDTLRVVAMGASKVDVKVMSLLDAQAMGASKIRYSGKPDVRKSIAVGASSIKHH